MTIPYENVKPDIGARIDATKAEMADPDFVAECLKLLNERIVLVFPEIGLTDKEQLVFTDLLGERVNFVAQGPKGEDPDIYKITLDPELNEQPAYVLGTFFWHMDGVMEEIPPPKASLLSCRKAATKGGQTEFANQFAAYEQLSDEDKADIEDLRVRHTVFSAIRPTLDMEVRPSDWKGISKQNVHPLVWRHDSGRKSLLVGTHAEEVIDMPLPEGRALLTRLMEWAAQPAFTYRHEWSEGDFVVWNNCGALHRVIPYGNDSGRTMHRTSIAGYEYIK